ncbi:hypothetical protein M413DRAFT_32026 [Hebeloma cylindrosporum]|uniref:Uncharacterized protein n=1 Tax=Hebeloma cylindrosporum TaxID=76867 RepID=A0A0C3BV76_HEBCY|nr:hypothetical protein M413DRAFT_32026 [Hebeloma cylindrosporum h7]
MLVPDPFYSKVSLHDASLLLGISQHPSRFASLCREAARRQRLEGGSGLLRQGQRDGATHHQSRSSEPDNQRPPSIPSDLRSLIPSDPHHQQALGHGSLSGTSEPPEDVVTDLVSDVSGAIPTGTVIERTDSSVRSASTRGLGPYCLRSSNRGLQGDDSEEPMDIDISEPIPTGSHTKTLRSPAIEDKNKGALVQRTTRKENRYPGPYDIAANTRTRRQTRQQTLAPASQPYSQNANIISHGKSEAKELGASGESLSCISNSSMGEDSTTISGKRSDSGSFNLGDTDTPVRNTGTRGLGPYSLRSGLHARDNKESTRDSIQRTLRKRAPYRFAEAHSTRRRPCKLRTSQSSPRSRRGYKYLTPAERKLVLENHKEIGPYSTIHVRCRLTGCLVKTDGRKKNAVGYCLYLGLKHVERGNCVAKRNKSDSNVARSSITEYSVICKRCQQQVMLHSAEHRKQLEEIKVKQEQFRQRLQRPGFYSGKEEAPYEAEEVSWADKNTLCKRWYDIELWKKHKVGCMKRRKIFT